MSSFLKDTFAGWKQIAGVELVLQNDGFRLRLCILEKKKGLITISDQKWNIETLAELKKFLNEDTPVSLTICGKGILTKKLESNENDLGKLLSQAVPNAKINDFYVQSLEAGNSRFLSIVRRNIVDEILALFRKEEISVISLTLSGIVIQALQALETEPNLIGSGEHQVEFKDGNVIRYSYTPDAAVEEFKSGNERINGTCVVAYASAFQQFLPEQLHAGIPEIILSKDEWQEKKLFTVAGWSVLGLFLTVLLINYLIFTWLSQKTEKIKMAANMQNGQVAQLKHLKEEVGEKKGFLESSGWMASSKASFYSDRIAAVTPPSVLLSSLEVNPPNEKISREKRKQVFEDGLILLTGICKRPIELNGWIKRLKDLPWVKKVNVDNYNYDSQEKEGTFKVEILVDEL